MQKPIQLYKGNGKVSLFKIKIISCISATMIHLVIEIKNNYLDFFLMSEIENAPTNSKSSRKQFCFSVRLSFVSLLYFTNLDFFFKRRISRQSTVLCLKLKMHYHIQIHKAAQNGNGILSPVKINSSTKAKMIHLVIEVKVTFPDKHIFLAAEIIVKATLARVSALQYFRIVIIFN